MPWITDLPMPEESSTVGSQRSVRLLLALLIVETGLLLYVYRPRIPYSEFALRTEIGKNYSLLIDNERLPLDVKGQQRLVIGIYGRPNDAQPLPNNRVRLHYAHEQEPMSALSQSRFRFSYDSADSLSALRTEEKLDRMRGVNEWETVKNVLHWTRSQFEPGQPHDYVTQDARTILRRLRSGSDRGFCSHYCYVLVQSLQSLGIYARYLTIQGHEVAEAWVPNLHKWVCLDPTNGAYFIDGNGRPLSAHEIQLNSENVQVLSKYPINRKAVLNGYTLLAYWLRNDLVENPVFVSDLNRYRVRLVRSVDEVKSIDVDDLFSFFPQDFYGSPLK